MPAMGELYEHKQIKGEIYRIVSLDTGKKKVQVSNISNRENPISLTFAQLSKKYRKVG